MKQYINRDIDFGDDGTSTELTQEEQEILIADYYLDPGDKKEGHILKFPCEEKITNPSQLKFTTSFDWIESVLEKIVKEGCIYKEVTNEEFTLINIIPIDKEENFKGKNAEKKFAIIEAVIQYITWYNKQKES